MIVFLTKLTGVSKRTKPWPVTHAKVATCQKRKRNILHMNKSIELIILKKKIKTIYGLSPYFN